MRAKYVTSKYELDDLTRLVIRVGLYVFPAWCRRTRWWFDYIMSASFGHRHHSTWFWELLYYFTVVERFARFAHARHHSDKLWSLVGGVDHRLPHPWLRRVSAHQQEKKTWKTCILKAETRVRTDSMILEARAGTFSFLTGICPPLGLSADAVKWIKFYCDVKMKSEASKGWQTEFKSETTAQKSGTRYQIWLLICKCKFFWKVGKVVVSFLQSDWQVGM